MASDNRHLAVIAPQPYPTEPNLQVIDVDDNNKASSRVVLKEAEEGSIAWSPDGQTIALTYRFRDFSGIKLISVVDARETARRELQENECWTDGSPITFTPDGGALWATCDFPAWHPAWHPPRGTPEMFPVAIKYRLPDLIADDRVVLQSPVAGARAGNFGYSLTTINMTPRLSAIIQYERPGKYEDAYSPFAYGFDLGRKAELFPPFNILDDRRSGLARHPKELILSPDATYGLLRLDSGTLSGQAPIDETLDRQFEGYDTRSGQRLVSFGGRNGKVPEAGVIGEAALLRDGQTIVGRWGRGPTREGGLVVLDARTGAVHQRIRFTGVHPLGNHRLALSPDGTRLASLTNGNEIRLYRTGQ